MTPNNASSPKHSELFARARAARAQAYAPYSGYAVGAAVLCADGTVFVGCNVENASFGLTQCAERAAISAAVASGRRTFSALAVAGPDGRATIPCGACRQVLAEFGTSVDVVYSVADGSRATSLAELLPAPFDLEVPAQ